MALSSDDLIIIEPKAGPLNLRFGELWRYHELLWALAWRDIRLRYSQTLLGVTWVILQPVLGALVFTLVFSLIAKLPSGGTPYFIISYAGLLGWNLFSSSLTRVSASLVANSSLITKVYFPRIILPLENIPSALLDFVVGLGFIAVLLLAFNVHPNWSLLVVPLAVVILIALALGVGIVLATLAVHYRDVQHIVPLALQLLMYGTPVGYTLRVVPLKYLSIYRLNPLVAPVECLRDGLIGAPTPLLGDLIYSSVVALILLLISAWVFRRFERNFADVI